jgi:hypothetical protein
LPLPKIREYLGPTPTRALLGLAPGEVTEPLATVGGQRILRLVAREPGGVRPLSDVRNLVRAEFQRQAGERNVRNVLAERRDAAEIHIAEERL